MFQAWFSIPSLPRLFWKKEEKSWDLNDPVVSIEATRGGLQSLLLQDLFRGVQVFGSTGSGKTSGSGRLLAHSYLKVGFGGLVLVVKNDEVDTWRRYCKETGREDDLVVVQPGSGAVFDFLRDQGVRNQDRLDVVNITQLILDVYALYTRGSGERGQDSFWIEQLQSSLNHAIVLSERVYGEVAAGKILETFRGAIQYADQYEAYRARKQKTQFEGLCEAVLERYPNDSELNGAIDYYQNAFRALAEKTRSIIVAMFLSLMEPLTQFPLKEVLSGSTTVSPRDSFQGKIIVVNLPVHDYRKAGLMCQLIWKMCFTRDVLRRVNPDRPVFLWADESQYFVEERDIQFLSTARSKRCSVVYLTQNISNYESLLGNSAKVAAILGSLNNKFFHQNNDPKTNDWASQAIGRIMKKEKSKTSGMGGTSITETKSMEIEVPARLFTNLKGGGDENGRIVEAIVHVPGKKFKDRTWFRAEFRQ